MRKRLIQIFGFLFSSLGWLFVCCTLAMDNWKQFQTGGMGGSNIVKVGWYWSNLWKDCFIDATAVTNCQDYGVLWSVAPYVQAVRGLLMGGMGLGFCGAVLAFLGMDCTYIGGTPMTNDKVLFASAVLHSVGGVSTTTGYCLYINRIAATYFTQNLNPNTLRYGVGAPVFLGLVGSFFIILGSVFYGITVFQSVFRSSEALTSRTYVSPQSRSRTMYTGYYKPSRLSHSRLSRSRLSRSRQSRQSSNSRVSKISQISTISRIEDGKMSDRDAFV